MKKKSFILFLIILSFLLLIKVGFAYSPPPGVLGPEQVDFGGKTITLVSTSYVFDRPPAERLERAKELFNIGGINHISADWGPLRHLVFQRVLAGDSDYDILFLEHIQGVWEFIGLGLFYPLSDLLPKEYYYEYLPEGDLFSVQGVTIGDGHYYGFGAIYVNDEPPFNVWLGAYNKRLLEQEGLPDPRKLIEEGEWTWEAANEIIREVTRDTSGDGNIDQWGLPTFQDFHAMAFAATNNVNPIINKDGRFVYNYNQIAAYEAIQQVKDWIPYMQTANSSNLQAFYDQQIALLFPIGAPDYRRIASNMEPDDWCVMPMPKGPEAETNIIPIRRFVSFYLPANTAAPEKKVALISYLFREIEEDRYPEYRYRFISREQYQLLSPFLKWDINIANPFEYTRLDDPIRKAVSSILNEDESPATALEAIVPEVQARIYDVFGK